MIKHRHVFLIYLAAFLLQPFLQNLIPVIGNNLNLILCLTVMLVFVYESPGQGVFFGSVFALLSDLFYGQYTGVSALVMVITAVAVYGLKYFSHIENFANAIIFMAGATLLYAGLYWGVYAAIGSTYTLGYALQYVLLQAVLNSVVGLGIYFVFVRRVIKHRRDRYYR